MHSLTEEQRHILAHSLGIVHYAQESYRNHFHYGDDCPLHGHASNHAEDRPEPSPFFPGGVS